MKIFKSAVIAFSLTVAMGAFSTAAIAESDAGRISHSPADVIKEVGARIDTAITAINNGAEDAEVAALIKKAQDFTKELNANDRVARETQKVRNHMKDAVKAAKTANLAEAKVHLEKAKAVNATLPSML